MLREEGKKIVPKTHTIPMHQVVCSSILIKDLELLSQCHKWNYWLGPMKISAQLIKIQIKNGYER